MHLFCVFMFCVFYCNCLVIYVVVVVFCCGGTEFPHWGSIKYYLIYLSTSAKEAREKLTGKGFTIDELPAARKRAAPATGTQRNVWQRAGKDKDEDTRRKERFREKLKVFRRE